MNIGFFDSGVGGLIMMKAAFDSNPHHNYIYFGDTLNMPFGEKNSKKVYELTQQGLEFLAFTHNCNYIVVACNTASTAIDNVMRDYFLSKGITIIDIISPTIETLGAFSTVGILATRATVLSKVYSTTIAKQFPLIKVNEVEAPLLASIIEEGLEEKAHDIIAHYVHTFDSNRVDALVLACTHFPKVYNIIKSLIPNDTVLISQEEIISKKIPQSDSLDSSCALYVTYLNEHHKKLISNWFPNYETLEEVCF